MQLAQVRNPVGPSRSQNLITSHTFAKERLLLKISLLEDIHRTRFDEIADHARANGKPRHHELKRNQQGEHQQSLEQRGIFTSRLLTGTTENAEYTDSKVLPASVLVFMAHQSF